MKNTKATFSLLILSAVLATPASGNWFANPRTGLNLNIGSAPNPVPGERIAFAEVAPPIAPAPPPAPYVPPPVAQAPPPLPQPAPPAPRPAVRMFVVFFDFDKFQLSQEAQAIVREAVAAARQQGGVRVVVTGHTDTVGSRAYNQRLSERRAQAVRNEMVRGGLARNEIATVGRNFADPLIATGPGVREPQNRRAVIDLGGLIS